MLSQEFLKRARQSAENAVSDMKDGELKISAFNVILTRLLSDDGDHSANTPKGDAAAAKTKVKQVLSKRQAQAASSGTLPSRILSFRDDGFFSSQRGLGDVRDELAKHGWHYPLTTLSGTMQKLIRDKELRRERIVVEPGKKKIWKYSNR